MMLAKVAHAVSIEPTTSPVGSNDALHICAPFLSFSSPKRANPILRRHPSTKRVARPAITQRVELCAVMPACLKLLLSKQIIFLFQQPHAT